MKKGKFTIPKEFHDIKIDKQVKKIEEERMTNKGKLQELEDILVRDLEGLNNFIILERRLKLILLIEQIKVITKQGLLKR